MEQDQSTLSELISSSKGREVERDVATRPSEEEYATTLSNVFYKLTWGNGVGWRAAATAAAMESLRDCICQGLLRHEGVLNTEASSLDSGARHIINLITI